MHHRKYVTIYRKKDRETWKKIRKALKDAGIRHVHAGHFLQDPVGINGIGGMVDPRDFGVGHVVDRDVYYIDVPEDAESEAREAARRQGLVCIVEEE